MLSRASSLPEIKELIKDCLTQLYNTDSFILERNEGEGVCERAIVFRFAHYLQNLVPEFFVDCDFNSSFEGCIDIQGNAQGAERHGKPIENEDGTVTNRFIDIIVHKRENNFKNDLICFEIKKWNNLNNEDAKKDRNNLRNMTSKYGYIYGFHLIIHKNKSETKWTIFHEGRPIEEESFVWKDNALEVTDV